MGDYRPVVASNRLSQRRVSTKYENAFFMSSPDVFLQYQVEKKQNQKEQNNIKGKTEVPQITENLHSWLILLAVFLYNVVMGYHYMCFGIYYVRWTERFETTKAATGIIGSLHSSVASFSSLFASAFIDLFGMRKVAVIGCLITSLGIFSTAFASNIYFIYISYGFTTGFGISLSGLSSQVAIQKNFYKHRSIATSFSVCGLPIGNIVSPFITNFLLSRLGWRGTLIIHSGILLNTVVLAMLMVTDGNSDSSSTSLKNFFKKLLDFSVLKNAPFIPLIVTIMLTRIIIEIFFSHVPSRAVHSGTTLQFAGYLVTILCVGSFCSRLSCSIITGFVTIQPVLCLVFPLGLQGVTAMSLPFCKTHVSIAVCTFCFGLMQGLLVPLILLTIVEITGVEMFGKSRAILNIFGSATSLIATPLGGWMFDVTQNYDIPFYFCGLTGVLASISTLVAFILLKLKRHQDQSNFSVLNRKNDDPITDVNHYEALRIRTFTF